MVAIALEDLKVEWRQGQKYPILILRDDKGNLVELFVRDDPVAARVKLGGLEHAISAQQARLPITKVFEPYRSKR